MQYFGGKYKTRKQIGNFINGVIERSDCSTYLEPFVGGMWILSEILNNNKINNFIANDLCFPLINLYASLQQSKIDLPDSISEKEYNDFNKERNENDPLLAFVGFGCSFSGKYFGGYARDNSGRNYCKNTKNSLLKKFNNPNINKVQFISKDYQEIAPPNNSIIYCDPPYLGTTQYSYPGMKDFNHDTFWQTMEEWGKNNIVIVSEYTCLSSEFSCVLEIPTKTDIRTKNGKEYRTEKLFMSK